MSLAAVPVFSLTSCDKAELLNRPPAKVEVPIDSTDYKWSVVLPDGIPAQKLDLFIYNGKKELVHKLEMLIEESLHCKINIRCKLWEAKETD